MFKIQIKHFLTIIFFLLLSNLTHGQLIGEYRSPNVKDHELTIEKDNKCHFKTFRKHPIRKQKGKRKYINDPSEKIKNETKEWHLDTLIQEAIWSSSNDTIFINMIGSYTGKYSSRTRYYRIEFEEYEVDSLDEKIIEVVDEQGSAFKLFKLSVNNLNPYRGGGFHKQYNNIFNYNIDQIDYIQLYRIDINQRLPKIVPKNKGSNYIKITAIEITDNCDLEQLSSTKLYFYLMGNKLCAGNSYKAYSHGGLREETFDKSDCGYCYEKR